jgi:hypothetical protein
MAEWPTIRELAKCHLYRHSCEEAQCFGSSVLRESDSRSYSSSCKVTKQTVSGCFWIRASIFFGNSQRSSP